MNRTQNSFGISIILHVLLVIAVLNMAKWDFPAPKLAIDFSMFAEQKKEAEALVAKKAKLQETAKKLPEPKIEKEKIKEKPVPPPPPPLPKEVIPEPIAKKEVPPPPLPPKVDIKPRRPPEEFEEKQLEIAKKRELQLEDSKLDKIETKRRMMEESRLDTLSKQSAKRMDEMDGLKQIGGTKPRTSEDIGGASPKIQTVQSRTDSGLNPPTLFYNSKPAKRVADDSTSVSTLSSVPARQRQDEGQSVRAPLKVASSIRRGNASAGGEEGNLKIGAMKRSSSGTADTEKVTLHVDVPKREAVVESETVKIKSVQTKAETKGGNIRADDAAYQASWQRIDNIGPLAHLNENCYGQPNGSIVVNGHYKFKCSRNQIVEAWKQVPN